MSRSFAGTLFDYLHHNSGGSSLLEKYVMTKLLHSCRVAVIALLFFSGAIFYYGKASIAGQTTQALRLEHEGHRFASHLADGARH